MSTKQDSIDECGVVADAAIMGYVGIRHEQVSVTIRVVAVFFEGSAVDGHPFAELIVVTDNDLSRSSVDIAFVLGFSADDAVLPEAISLADRGPAGDRHMTFQPTARPQHDMGPNITEWPDIDVFAQMRRADRCRPEERCKSPWESLSRWSRQPVRKLPIREWNTLCHRSTSTYSAQNFRNPQQRQGFRREFGEDSFKFWGAGRCQAWKLVLGLSGLSSGVSAADSPRRHRGTEQARTSRHWSYPF